MALRHPLGGGDAGSGEHWIDVNRSTQTVTLYEANVAVAAYWAAMATANGLMSALGVTDPREWELSDWVSDVVPHLAYGAVTAGSLELALRRSDTARND